jgi:hypothetical protein
VVARRYRDAAVGSERPSPYVEAVSTLTATAEGFIRYPNERLQLVALFARLPPLAEP